MNTSSDILQRKQKTISVILLILVPYIAIFYIVIKKPFSKKNNAVMLIMGVIYALCLIVAVIASGASNNTSDDKTPPLVSASPIITQDANEQESPKETGTASIKPSSSIDVTDKAIELTANTLKADELIKDVAIEKSNGEKTPTIIIAIQANASTSKDHAKDIVDSAVRQLGFNCGGQAPTKDYLGEIWDNYYGQIRIFSGTNTIIVDATISKGSSIIIYH